METWDTHGLRLGKLGEEVRQSAPNLQVYGQTTIKVACHRSFAEPFEAAYPGFDQTAQTVPNYQFALSGSDRCCSVDVSCRSFWRRFTPSTPNPARQDSAASLPCQRSDGSLIRTVSSPSGRTERPRGPFGTPSNQCPCRSTAVVSNVGAKICCQQAIWQCSTTAFR